MEFIMKQTGFNQEKWGYDEDRDFTIQQYPVVCFKIGFTSQSGYFDGENCRWPMDFGVPYFQTNLGGIDNLQSGWWYGVCLLGKTFEHMGHEEDDRYIGLLPSEGSQWPH